MTTKMPDDCLELKESIEKETGFALTFEGIHKWIAFIHSKQNDILPVPNRYFGVYEDGTLKDTPIFFRKFQQEVLETMSKGNNIKEVKALLPKVVDIYHKYVQLLKENIPIWLEIDTTTNIHLFSSILSYHR
jgi:DNA polymerase elongation subunit (family B)